MPKEHLESRQSGMMRLVPGSTILPKEHLESRQSQGLNRLWSRRFCRKNIWNQGKATTERSERTNNFAERTFGIKAKRNAALGKISGHFAERTFGIKAKPGFEPPVVAQILPKEHLESRQSHRPECSSEKPILPKEHLESRQSPVFDGVCAQNILPKEHLESRQSREARACGGAEQLVVVGGCSPRWRQKNVSPLMLSDFREGGVADFVSEADFRAAETEILRRRLSAAQDELVRLRAPQGV